MIANPMRAQDAQKQNGILSRLAVLLPVFNNRK